MTDTKGQIGTWEQRAAEMTNEEIAWLAEWSIPYLDPTLAVRQILEREVERRQLTGGLA